MSISLTDKAIIITGASSGIGAATALACASAGMPVLLNGRHEVRLENVAKQIRSLGQRAEIVVGDVTDSNFSEQLLDTAEHSFDGFYAVFANAGIGLDQPLNSMSTEEIRRHFEINFFSSVDLNIQAAKRLIADNKSGHLITNSSCLAKFTIPGHGAYSAAKSAQNHFSRAMGMELKSHNIYVSSVLPITTATSFFSTAATKRGLDGPQHMLPTHTPKIFIQKPERVARAIVKCLRSPRPEVWTSFTVRLTAAMFTLSPRLADFILSRSGTR
ncbi:MAG: SDR family NAD(P)-dependent oxidoreductase [Phycisphaerales bacterium]|nr:SDR family NAD(P)-dependent oxidoreductase [Phycisphaerales bacterium]